MDEIEQYRSTVEHVHETYQKGMEHTLSPTQTFDFVYNAIMMMNSQKVKLMLESDISTKMGNKIEKIKDSIIHETNDLGWNVFSAFNAVTHYTTHKINNTANKNVYGNFFGLQNTANQRAYKQMHKLVN